MTRAQEPTATPARPCACATDHCVLCAGYLTNGLGARQVCQIQGMIGHRRFHPGEVVFREGFPSEYLYVVKSGYVKLTTMLPDGREQIVQLGVAGHVLGVEVLNDPVYRYSAHALTECRLCSIRHPDMVRVLKENPEVSLDVIQRLNADLERSRALIRDLGLMNSLERMASFLLSLLPSQHDPAQGLPLPLSRREIAEMLGLTVETVSRVMARLARQGVIDAPRGSLRICDPDQLRQLAGLSAEASGRDISRPN